MKRIILCLGIFGCLTGVVKARDLGQWDAGDPAIRAPLGVRREAVQPL
jgi:hypothetical protein